jgi:hypothetical protein
VLIVVAGAAKRTHLRVRIHIDSFMHALIQIYGLQDLFATLTRAGSSTGISGEHLRRRTNDETAGSRSRSRTLAVKWQSPARIDGEESDKLQRRFFPSVKPLSTRCLHGQFYG